MKSITAFFRNIWFAQRNAAEVVHANSRTADRERIINNAHTQMSSYNIPYNFHIDERIGWMKKENDRLRAQLAALNMERGTDGRFKKKGAK